MYAGRQFVSDCVNEGLYAGIRVHELHQSVSEVRCGDIILRSPPAVFQREETVGGIGGVRFRVNQAKSWVGGFSSCTSRQLSTEQHETILEAMTKKM